MKALTTKDELGRGAASERGHELGAAAGGDAVTRGKVEDKRWGRRRRPALAVLGFALTGSFLQAQGTVAVVEPNDAVSQANESGFTAGGSGLRLASGNTNDGSYGVTGDGTGDFDFFRIPAAAGQTILLDLKNGGTSAGFDSYLALYSYDGVTATKVAENDDVSGTNRASRLSYAVTTAGDYYAVVGNWVNVAGTGTSLPRDPLTPGTGYGLPGGVGGPYQLFIGLDAVAPIVQFDGGNAGNPVRALKWTRVAGEAGYRQTAVLKVSNTGTAPYVVTGGVVSGPDAARFGVSGLTVPLTLAPGGGVTLNLSYTGDGVNASGLALLDLTSNDLLGLDYELEVADSLLTGGGRFTVRQVHAASGVTVNSFAVADDLLAGINAGSSASQPSSYVNYSAGGVAAGFFAGDRAFPDTAGSGENYVTQATGKIYVRQAGTYSFRGYADDGQRLVIDGQQVFASGAANVATFRSVELTVGVHDVEYTHYETSGGDTAELSVATTTGVYTTNAGAEWELLEAYNPDGDADGLPDAWETANGFNPGSAAGVDGAAGDPDADASGNLAEYLAGTNPRNADTDGDGLKDGVESKTGVWVGILNTGTDPLVRDSDGDGLSDGVENPGLAYVGLAQPGTDPNKRDTDGDSYADLSEITLGTNPKETASVPQIRYQTVLSENFDGGGFRSSYGFTSSSGGFVPEVTATGVAAQGQAAQLTAAQQSNNNSIAWDYVSAAPAPVLRLTFDFRISNESDPADGLGIGFFRTGGESGYGETGAINPAASKIWENPFAAGGHPEAVVIGFGVYGTDYIRIAGPAVPGAALGQVAAPFSLSNGLFNRAIVTAVTNGPGSTVFSLEVIQDVNGAATRRVIFSYVVVPGFSIADEKVRLIAGGRTGAAFSRIDLDNVELAAPGQPQPVVVASTHTLDAVELRLEDHPSALVNPATVRATVNGVPVVLNVVKNGGVTTATYRLPAGTYFPAGSNVVVFNYSDTGGNGYVETQTFQTAPYKVLPEVLAREPGTAGAGGFDVKVFQTAPTGNGGLLNYWEVAEGVLDGVSGGPFPAGNLADLSGAVNGRFRVPVVNFEQEGLSGGLFGGDSRYPGITGASNDYITVEALTWVRFPAAGFYTLGVNSDDGFRASYGHAPLPALEIVSPVSGAKIIPVTPSLTGVNGGIGAAYPSSPVTARLVLGDPILGGQPYNNAAELNGNIAVVDRGGSIPFSTKAQYAADAGAIAVLVINQTAPTIIAPVSTGTNVAIPYGHINKPDGDRIKALIAENPGGVLARFGTDRDRILNEATTPANATFGVIVSKPGLYPLRLAQVEVTGGASVEWYSVDDAGNRHLLNDAGDAQALSAYATVIEPAPEITVQRVNEQVVIQYSGVLQWSPDLSTPFADVAGAVSPYTVPAGAPGRLFFRARR